MRQIDSYRKRLASVGVLAGLGITAFTTKSPAAIIFGTAGVVNINAQQSGINQPNGQFTGAGLVTPLQVTFQPGVYNGSITSSVLAPLTASYIAWQFTNTTPLSPTYLENFEAFNDNGGAPITTSTVINFQSTNFFLTSAQAFTDGFAEGAFTFTIPHVETLDFVVPDNNLTDNTGGVSVAITQVSAIPEPAMMGAVGILMLASIRRRRRITKAE